MDKVICRWLNKNVMRKFSFFPYLNISLFLLSAFYVPFSSFFLSLCYLLIQLSIYYYNSQFSLSISNISPIIVIFISLFYLFSLSLCLFLSFSVCLNYISPFSLSHLRYPFLLFHVYKSVPIVSFDLSAFFPSIPLCPYLSFYNLLSFTHSVIPL